MEELTPRKIVEELDKYIVGQDEAKRAVAIALRNRWRRLNLPKELREEVAPKNIIMIGPTGVGKTEIARRLAMLVKAPFIKVEATKFTEVGYVGRDVESIIRDLVEIAVNMVKEEKMEKVEGRAKELAYDRLAELIVEKKLGIKREPVPFQRLLEQMFPIQPRSEIQRKELEVNKEAKERTKELLKKGELMDEVVELSVSSEIPGVNIIGIGGDVFHIQEILSNLFPKPRKLRKMKAKEALRYLIQEEAQKLIDMDEVVREAINRVENQGIVFIDEIDKIASRGTGGGPDVSREGVQRDLLPIVEGCKVSTRYGLVRTDHILFIAAGAFHIAKPSDLLPELQGRFPIRVELKPLTKKDFVRILTEPKNALTKQYKALLSTD